MNPDVGTFAQIAVLIVTLVGSLALITVGLVRGVAPRKRALPADRVEERFDQLQQSVDAIAIEVERIAEAQRFTTKLLAERAEGSPVER